MGFPPNILLVVVLQSTMDWMFRRISLHGRRHMWGLGWADSPYMVVVYRCYTLPRMTPRLGVELACLSHTVKPCCQQSTNHSWRFSEGSYLQGSVRLVILLIRSSLKNAVVRDLWIAMVLGRLGLQNLMVMPPGKTKNTTDSLPGAFDRLNALNRLAIGNQAQDLQSTSPPDPLASTDGRSPSLVLSAVGSMDVECSQWQTMRDETKQCDWVRTDIVGTLAGLALPEACLEPCLEREILT